MAILCLRGVSYDGRRVSDLDWQATRGHPETAPARDWPERCPMPTVGYATSILSVSSDRKLNNEAGSRITNRGGVVRTDDSSLGRRPLLKGLQ